MSDQERARIVELVAALSAIKVGTLEALGIPEHKEAVRSGDGDYLVIDAMQNIARKALDALEAETAE